MGNEDKIKDLVPLAKAEFLPDEVTDKEPKAPEYSLDTEFAKSKQNKNYSFYLVIGAFLLAVIGGSFGYTQFIQEQHHKTEIGFVDFDELNLKELLSSTQKEEKNLNEAKEDLRVVKSEKKDAITKIKIIYAEKINTVKSKNLDNKESKPLIQNLKAEELKEIEAVEKSYEPKIKDEENKVTKREQILQAKRQKMKAEVNKADAIVSNYKELHNMQMDRKKEQLVLRYNPVYSSRQLTKIVRRSRGSKIRKPILTDYEKRLYKAGLLTKGEFNVIRSKIENYQKLTARMQKVPYTNSIKPTVDVMQDSSYFLISEYERLMNRLSMDIQNKNHLLSRYKHAFRHLSQSSPDSGVVIDGSDNTRLLISMKPLLKISEGDKAYVFRNSDQIIATILFYRSNKTLTARVIEKSRNARIRPFDKIYLKREDAKKIPENGATQPIDESSTKPNTENKPNNNPDNEATQ